VLVEPAEMAQRIRAALDARRDADTMIMARTEALGAKSLDETIDRACRYVEAGAEMIFVNGLLKEADVERAAREIPGPQLYNVSTSGKTPHLHVDRLKALGFRLAIYPAHSLFLALHGIQQMLAGLKAQGTIQPWLDRMISFQEWQRVTGVPEVEALERRYAASEGK
jgi:2-methylisocitrate lyase-like PEP mutase family enzyme